MTPRSFRLTPKLLGEHRPGALLALDEGRSTRSYSLAPTRAEAVRTRIVRAAQDLPPVPPDGEPMEPREFEPAPGVAIVEAFGPMAARGEPELCGWLQGYDDIENAVMGAFGDPDVGAVVLVIDSPGGDYARCAETMARLRAAADDNDKPYLAFVDEFAASAGYWLASTADQIFVPSTGMVGSIGVILVHCEASKALEQEGITPTLIRAPDGKALGHPAEPLSDLGRERLGTCVAEAYAVFASAIAARRPMSLEQIAALNADLLTGEAAVSAGLADGVASLDQVIALAATQAAARRSAAPEGAAKGHASMKVSPAVLAFLPNLPESAGAAVVETAILPLLGLARAALNIAGTTDIEAAEGILRANATEVIEITRLRGEKERAKVEDAKTERYQLVGKMVSTHRVSPAEAWARDQESGAIVGVAPEWDEPNADGIGIGLGALRAMVAKLEPSTLGREAKADESSAAQSAGLAASLVTLTGSDRAECARSGRNPQKFAAVKAALFPRSPES